MPVSLFVCLSAFNHYEIPSALFFYLIKLFVALFEAIAFVDYSENVCKKQPKLADLYQSAWI